MATRQYIGARYVIKVYENTQNPESAEWQSGTSYEPLTMVTYQNSSYLSKKAVPSTIGTPASNPTYWVVTGAYNGQIANLQSQITTINNVIGSLSNLKTISKSSVVNAINSTLDNNRKYIFIGDSYGEQTNNWMVQTKKELSIPNDNYYSSAVGGAGFAFGTTFLSQLQTIENTLPSGEAEKITDIVVCGGFNDRAVTPQSTVLTAIETFHSYCVSHFPNAKVHVGFIGWSFNSEFVSELIRYNVLNTYKQCSTVGCIYINHSDEVMHDSRLFKEEPQTPYNLFLGYQYVHPNQDGSKAISNCISNHLRGNGYSGVSYDSNITVTPDLSTGVSIGVGSLDLIMDKSNNIINITKALYNLTTINFATPVSFASGGLIEIGFLRSGLVAGIDSTHFNTRARAYIPIVMFALDGTNKTVNGFLVIANNRLYVQAYGDGITSCSTIGIFGASGIVSTNLN